ncbi:MAG: glycosyltransferase family 4 protein [Oscillospiraceae bacterium]|nr:glycosyltransferase family 4 protein [Oscillospiraceae bacterium]
MKTIAFVAPWFDDHIPGGAEMELREVSAHLHKAGAPVEILTTCVKEFGSDWSVNFHKAGTSTLESGIPIRRFPVRKRDTARFDAVNAKLIQKMPVTLEEEDVFLSEMVNSPELYEYIRTHQDAYSVFVYIPYMFGTTYYGVQAAPEKAVLIPCFHDEGYAYFQRFREVFRTAAGMVYNARPEMELAERLYGFSETGVRQILMGIGMDTSISGDAERFRKKYRMDQPFLLYAGRKDTGKNVHTLLQYFSEYRKRHETDLQLVLIGGGSIEIPADVRDAVHDLGFVDAQDKYDARAAAELLCQPSKNESFSLVIMESWLCGRPVLVHDACAVTKNFARESNGGLYFADYFEFEGCVNYILHHPEIARIMGENGGSYVREHFDWDVITQKYLAFFAEIEG